MIPVREGWTASYDPALRVSAGEPLEVGRGDDEWPGWVWCENATGLGGWLPLETVGDGRALEDFDTCELTVAAGERVDPGERRAGWTWCRRGERAGWVPDRCLEGMAPLTRGDVGGSFRRCNTRGAPANRSIAAEAGSAAPHPAIQWVLDALRADACLWSRYQRAAWDARDLDMDFPEEGDGPVRRFHEANAHLRNRAIALEPEFLNDWRLLDRLLLAAYQTALDP